MLALENRERVGMKSGKPPGRRHHSEQSPRGGIKAATRGLLLESAVELMQDGDVPSLSDVARKAGVSRATAYRYFPSRSMLITAVVDHSLGPVRRYSSTQTDGRRRVEELFTSTFPRFKDFEAQMRAALQLSLEHWAQERAGTLEEEPYRRGHRIGILGQAVAPLQGKLNPGQLDRLQKALSVIYGIEPYVILKDIWGANDQETESIALWMANALVTASLLEADAAEHRPTHNVP
ncbi:MAG: TetR/AcrR family transcriptional regulator [Lautropia sp.]|nr:TetR/AcrR family transcriptional regulator [Lautropia sp.]